MARGRKKKGMLEGYAFQLKVDKWAGHWTTVQVPDSGVGYPALSAWRGGLPVSEEYPRSIALFAKDYDTRANWEWRHYFDRGDGVRGAVGPCSSIYVGDGAGLLSLLSNKNVQAFLAEVEKVASGGPTWDTLLNVATWAREQGAKVEIVNMEAVVEGPGPAAAWRKSVVVLEALAKIAFEDAIEAQEEAQRAREESR